MLDNWTLILSAKRNGKQSISNSIMVYSSAAWNYIIQQVCSTKLSTAQDSVNAIKLLRPLQHTHTSLQFTVILGDLLSYNPSLNPQPRLLITSIIFYGALCPSVLFNLLHFNHIDELNVKPRNSSRKTLLLNIIIGMAQFDTQDRYQFYIGQDFRIEKNYNYNWMIWKPKYPKVSHLY